MLKNFLEDLFDKDLANRILDGNTILGHVERVDRPELAFVSYRLTLGGQVYNGQINLGFLIASGINTNNCGDFQMSRSESATDDLHIKSLPEGSEIVLTNDEINDLLTSLYL